MKSFFFFAKSSLKKYFKKIIFDGTLMEKKL